MHSKKKGNIGLGVSDMATKTKTVQYQFKVTGGFDVDSGLEPLLDASGAVYGFRLPDGRECDLAICLRVEGEGGEEFVVDEQDLGKLGFDGLVYEYSEFNEVT